MCKSSIIVPFRKRDLHLSIFIPAMRKYLPDAKIVVVEQADDKPFNRGKLLNIGWLEDDHSDYSIFHDVDKIPIQVDYSLPILPTQLEKSEIQIKDYFGGVTMFDDLDFLEIGGYSNNFWGWGGEDNDLHKQVVHKGYNIEYRNSIFKSLPHPKSGTFDAQKWKQSQMPRRKDDGVKNCNYKLISREEMDGYTLIKVEL